MSETTTSIVIIGGGHAAVQLCGSLVEAGQGARIHLVCAESELPYHRPPLSKAFLKASDDTMQLLRGAPWYADHGVTLHLGDAATSIDRERKTVQLQSGRGLPYGQLVLATGTRARSLPNLPLYLTNVAVLRNAADARRLRGMLAAVKTLTVLGGGFIGLEIAATARLAGKSVTIIESAPRLLTRSVSPEIAEHVLATQRAAGVDVRLGVSAGGFEIDRDRLAAITVDGERHPVELLVLGIGAEPEHTLATAAGLACANGIVVDSQMRTEDPDILAIGDCSCFPEHGSGRQLRLESVQNANDQARTAAATLLGRTEPYQALPWFWSEQGAQRLQMAGLMPAEGTRYRRPGATAGSFSVLHYVGDALVCVESVNAPMDHIASRKLLELRKNPPPAQACDPAVALKSFA